MDKELIEKLEKHINDKLEKEYKIELPFYEFGTFSYELAQEIEKLFAIPVVIASTEILAQENKWLRLIKCVGGFKIQVRYFFEWHDVTFGPYHPMKPGIRLFSNYTIIFDEYCKCLQEGKKYTLGGVR